MDDDLRREASDPTTPGERLRTILSLMRERTCDESTFFEARAVNRAVFGNPNVPPELLSRAVLSHMEESAALAAWHNPVLPALLLCEPAPDYRGAAWVVLRFLGEERIGGGRAQLTSTLEEEVARLAASTSTEPRQVARRRLARHLAGLFGLPWPSPADSDSEGRGDNVDHSGEP